MHLHQIFSTFKTHENKYSKTSHTLNTKNEWSDYNKYMIAMEEKEWDENNIREFIKFQISRNRSGTHYKRA